ncbi:MAG: metallophosphoesterase family protein [Nitrospiraceae bacterium]
MPASGSFSVPRNPRRIAENTPPVPWNLRPRIHACSRSFINHAGQGNVDEYEHSGFPSETVIELAGLRIAIRHILHEDGKLTKDGRAFLDRERPDICVVSHTHQPKAEWFEKTLLFNPGSAGPKRFKLPQGVGILR